MRSQEINSNHNTLNNYDYLFMHKNMLLIVLVISILYKLFFFLYQGVIFESDAEEYLHLKDLLANTGIINYIKSTDVISFWRLPFTSFMLFLCKTNEMFFIVQLFLSYSLSYNIFVIFNNITSNVKLSLIIGICSLFIPYVNISACCTLSEFLQIYFYIYMLKKTILNELDFFYFSGSICVILLRPEMYTFVILLLLKDIYQKRNKTLIFYFIPFSVMLLWMARNKDNFDSFSLVNPILSSRALVGSVYPHLYVSNPHPFHEQHDYFHGKDYPNRKNFIAEYKKLSREAVINKIKDDPIGYIHLRLERISYAFLYFGFNFERLPNEKWHFQKYINRDLIAKTNQQWAYNVIFENREYGKILCRILYNGGLVLLHLLGIIFLFINFRKFWEIIFIFVSFGYIFFIEIDMRYMITIQTLSLCCAICGIYSIYKNKSLVFFNSSVLRSAAHIQ